MAPKEAAAMRWSPVSRGSYARKERTLDLVKQAGQLAGGDRLTAYLDALLYTTKMR